MISARASTLALASLAAIWFAVQSGGAAEPVACPDEAPASGASAAFDAYCRRCHDPEKLSASYFAGADAQNATRRESELAAFLDRHSACPHRHHEEIAAWLKDLASQQ